MVLYVTCHANERTIYRIITYLFLTKLEIRFFSGETLHISLRWASSLQEGTDFCPSPIFIIVFRLNCFSMMDLSSTINEIGGDADE
jgi:hypothetical protein